MLRDIFLFKPACKLLWEIITITLKIGCPSLPQDYTCVHYLLFIAHFFSIPLLRGVLLWVFFLVV